MDKSRLDYNALLKKGDADMCTVFEATWAEDLERGKAQGIIEMSYDFELSDDEILKRLQLKLNVSL